ncbi:hypothetical protein JOF53_001818 [Crossiella equi]|uniref:Uncharacterized protein n=1 Tax=Crossiella equi TaxID=130796 RepID=A0ABS5A8N3_9PSEU|nr:hypothetical protein [Crossiella equi]MBP2472946.1 hypothetical protein [Crossiella equi]
MTLRRSRPATPPAFCLAHHPTTPTTRQVPCLRLDLGPGRKVLEEAVTRLVDADIHYDMPADPHG